MSITSNFTGSQVVVFGTIERDAQTVSRNSDYQIVITLAGEPTRVIARRKERIAGVWINGESQTLRNVPSFLAVATSAPFSEIAGSPVRAPLGLGFDMLPIARPAESIPPIRTDFAAAFLRLMQQQGLYELGEGKVTFLSPRLFRAPIDLPANVPVGWYKATVYLFSGGVLLSRTSGAFAVSKTGFEQLVTDFAHRDPAIYGLATVIIACLTGWLAGMLFKRN